MIASGLTFGPRQQVILHLLDIAAMEEKLHGVVMEIEDCAFPLVAGVLATSKEPEAFKQVFPTLICQNPNLFSLLSWFF